MRIISGKHKGRRLTAPKNLPVRPTTDMSKESLFNILNNLYYIEDLTVLDLFTGTGNISFEFASRGAEGITAVDQHFGCIKFINQINKELDFSINTIKSDVYKFIDKTAISADIVFADPPYNFTDEQFLKIATTIFEKNILKEDGLLIIEHSKQTKLNEHPNFSYDKRYGGNVFSFFEAQTKD
ncbi:RsmD family RNA methyltransferase [Flavicella sediminum]|uniref:RsmD family RNA methyltransferase n=1 Tax=Flavicella sediminum TaxID=2585141 RepID=UPI00111CDAB4|nr:RsmD family RNA methyltransferase [Flavicella sediminum]